VIAAKARMLAALLTEMREQDPGYFPDEAWVEIHKTFAILHVEIVLPQRLEDGRIPFFLSRVPACRVELSR
jgi:hypothetical protein